MYLYAIHYKRVEIINIGRHFIVYCSGGKDEVKDVKAPALDATAKEALALVEKRKENAQDDLVVTQEPLLSLEQLINRRINENDSGKCSSVISILYMTDT